MLLCELKSDENRALTKKILEIEKLSARKEATLKKVSSKSSYSLNYS